MTGDPRRWSGDLLYWLAIAASIVFLAWILSIVQAPSPPLFAGLITGVFAAVGLRTPKPFPRGLRKLSLALVGVGAGAMVDRAVVAEVVQRPLVMLAGVAGTIAITLAAGQVLRFSRHVDGPTAMLASIAGGASGVSAVAKEMDADEGIVLSIQYLRVVVVVLSVPFVSVLLGAGSPGQVAAASMGDWSGLGFTALAVSTGLIMARYLRFSASSLILPMAVAVVLSLTQVMPSSTVPPSVLNFAYGLIGLAVGLSLTRSSLRRLATLMPLALIQLVIGVVGCAFAGIVFARSVGISDLDGYLATSPGGIPVVVAVAMGSGADVGLVLTMQILRLVAALMMAPLVARYLRNRNRSLIDDDEAS
ncbi:AbrB family transcriptional regulator [Arthrobacter sp. FW306-04-A]|uniref:AbrB family transcriptional regulator n=1 Tax=Arthrobacter sp. FW306-04-A TaxID=2879619 RepID=UPI0037BFCFBF|nr:AbrB family transcriptional regulator [Arthrobacter sp. FW306-04-A]